MAYKTILFRQEACLAFTRVKGASLVVILEAKIWLTHHAINALNNSMYLLHYLEVFLFNAANILKNDSHSFSTMLGNISNRMARILTVMRIVSFSKRAATGSTLAAGNEVLIQLSAETAERKVTRELLVRVSSPDSSPVLVDIMPRATFSRESNVFDVHQKVA